MRKIRFFMMVPLYRCRTYIFPATPERSHRCAEWIYRRRQSQNEYLRPDFFLQFSYFW